MTLTSGELSILNNCLNEVVNGFTVQGLEEKIGVASHDEAATLLRVINKACNSGKHRLLLKRIDLHTLAKIVHLTVVEVEREFAIRTGFSAKEAEEVASALQNYL